MCTDVLGVVEESAIPQIMEAASVVMEETAVGAVELVQTVHGVLTRVAVYHIQQHGDTTTVRFVDQLFQLIGRSVPTTVQRHIT